MNNIHRMNEFAFYLLSTQIVFLMIDSTIVYLKLWLGALKTMRKEAICAHSFKLLWMCERKSEQMRSEERSYDIRFSLNFGWHFVNRTESKSKKKRIRNCMVYLILFHIEFAYIILAFMSICFNKHIIHIFIYKCCFWFFFYVFPQFLLYSYFCCCFVLFHLCRQDFCFVLCFFVFSGFVRQLLGSVRSAHSRYSNSFATGANYFARDTAKTEPK